MTEDPKLHRVTLQMCELCLAGKGGECHSPGCAFWINRAPDMPLSYVEACDPPHPDAFNPYPAGWNPYLADRDALIDRVRELDDGGFTVDRLRAEGAELRRRVANLEQALADERRSHDATIEAARRI